MWAYFLQMYLNPMIHENQHGFRPGKSVATAIKQVYEEAITTKY